MEHLENYLEAMQAIRKWSVEKDTYLDEWSDEELLAGIN